MYGVSQSDGRYMVGVCKFIAAAKADDGMETKYSAHAQIARIIENGEMLSLYDHTCFSAVHTKLYNMYYAWGGQ